MEKPQIPEPILKFAQRNCPQDLQGYAVKIEQKGVMRLAPDKPWSPFFAKQLISSDKVEFEWHAKVNLKPFLWAKVLDAYRNQHGKLNAKLWGFIPLAKASGPDVDRSEAQRYLAELPWCPSAMLTNPKLNFKNISANVVRVWYGNEQTYVDLHFDPNGDVVSSYTKTREREGFGCQPWIGQFESYQEIGGLRVPTRGNVRWEAPEGPFEYWRGELVSLKVIKVKEV